MTSETMIPIDAKMQEAIAEMKHLILQHFPEATFDIGPGEDPVGMYLTATVDREDLWDLIDLCSDRLVDLQVDEGIPLYVIPSRPLARTMEMLQRARERTPWVYRARA
jgi:hypothetical protein